MIQTATAATGSPTLGTQAGRPQLDTQTGPSSGCPKTGLTFSRFPGSFPLWLPVSAMATFLAALLEKTGIRRFFSGVSVELPAYFLPNFHVVEIQTTKLARQRPIPHN
jgi:hypothetical protein